MVPSALQGPHDFRVRQECVDEIEYSEAMSYWKKEEESERSEVERKFNLGNRKYGLGVEYPQPTMTTRSEIALSILFERGYNCMIGFEYNPEDDLGLSLKRIKALWNEVAL